MVNVIQQVLACLKLYRVNFYILLVISSIKIRYKGCDKIRMGYKSKEEKENHI